MMENVRETLNILMNRRQWNQKFQQMMEKVYSDPDIVNFCEEHHEDLTSDAIERSAAKLYEYVSERDRSEQDGKNIHVGYRPILVLSNHLIDIEYVPTDRQIAEQKAMERNKLVHSISIAKNIRSASFDQYFRDESRNDAFEKAMQFFIDYTDKPQTFHKGLYLSGSFGVGKTYLMGALANELANNGYATTMVHFPSFTEEMKASIGSNSVSEKLNALKTAPILILDDLGADNSNSWIRDDILGVILEYRMQEELATFVTSNMSMNQLETEYLSVNQRNEHEPLKAKRLMERIRFLMVPVEMVGKNFRND